MATEYKLGSVLCVERETLRLDVGAKLSAQHRAFVVSKSGPVEGLDQVVNRALYQAGTIRVLDTKHESAAGAARQQIDIEGRAKPADV